MIAMLGQKHLTGICAFKSDVDRGVFIRTTGEEFVKAGAIFRTPGPYWIHQENDSHLWLYVIRDDVWKIMAQVQFQCAWLQPGVPENIAVAILSRLTA
jgi:hypothetical protein